MHPDVAPIYGANMRTLFLDNAAIVLDAISDGRVGAAWNEPSVLEGQTVGSLAGHLARGGVWVVRDYLDADTPTSDVDFETAAAYFSAISEGMDASVHRGIRRRGAEVAASGHAGVVTDLTAALDGLRNRLADEPADRKVTVFAGRVMRLDDYLWTRLVEQVVHLDDLARSIGVEPWPTAPDAASIVLSCGAEIGRRRFGDAAMIRALYRDDPTVLPVL